MNFWQFSDFTERPAHAGRLLNGDYMTDTTDIAALTLQRLLDKRPGGVYFIKFETHVLSALKHVLLMSARVTELEKAIKLADAYYEVASRNLEAERQRVAEITGQYVDRTTALSFATQRAEAAEARVKELEDAFDLVEGMPADLRFGLVAEERIDEE